MLDYRRLLERIVCAGFAGIVLLILFASLLNPTIFAKSNPKAFDNSQREMTLSSAEPPEFPLTKKSCKKTPLQCSSLCQTALSAEFQAAQLEKSSQEAHAKADKVGQRAVSIEQKAILKLQKLSMPNYAASPRPMSSRAKACWKLVAVIPRMLVSSEARVRARQEEKEAQKFVVTTLPNYFSPEAAELLMKSQKASQAAEEAKKAAAEAKTEADQARAHADSLRQSYASCLSGREPQ